MSIGSVVAIDSGDVGNSANLESFDNKELNIINEEAMSIDNQGDLSSSIDVEPISVDNQVDVSERDLDVNYSSENISVNDSIYEDNNVKSINEDIKNKDSSVSTSSKTFVSLSNAGAISSLKATSTTIRLTDILNAAKVFNDYVASKKGLPDLISVGGKNYTTEQFLYLMTSAINNIYNGKTSATYTVNSVESPSKDLNGDWVTSSSISKANYVDLAKRVLNYINSNGRAPNYATLSDGKKANYDLYTAAFASIITYYKNNKALLSSYVFSNSIFESYSISSILLNKSSEKLTFYLTTDDIIDSSTDNAALNTIKNTLTALGYNVKIIGVGPNMHNIAYKSGCTGSNSVLLCCFGGVDVCPIEEWVGKTPGLGSWFPNAYAGANILSVFYLDPYGCAANLNDYVGKAWDAKSGSYYGEPLDNPAKYMKDNGISYIQTGTVAQVCAILNKMFKGVSNSITPTTPTASTTSTNSESSFTVSQIISSAVSLKSYVLSNKELPSTVTVGNSKVPIAKFSYLMGVAIQSLKNGKSLSTKISLLDVSTSKPSGNTISKTISLSSYMTVTNNVVSYVKTNKLLPNYATVSGVKAEFKVYTYAFAKILAFYKSNNRLSNTCLFESGVFKSTSSSSSSSNSSSSSSSTSSVTISQIMAAAVNFKSYVGTNKVLPSTVTVNGVKYTTAQFSYLMSVAIQNLNSKKSLSTKVSVISVSNKSAVYTVSKTLSLANSVSIAKSVSSTGSSSKVLPAYVSLSSVKYDYRVYTYAFAKILAFYKSNNRLPNTCLFESGVFKSTSSGSSSSGSSSTNSSSSSTNSSSSSTNSSSSDTVTVTQVISSAVNLKSYVDTNKVLPSTVTVNGVKYTTAQFAYLMGVAMQNIKNGKSLSTKISVLNVSTSNPSGDTISKTIDMSNYMTVTNNVVTYVKNNKLLPNYATVSGVKAEFKVYTYAFAKILAFYKSNNRLPNTCLFESGVFKSNSSSSSSSISGITYKKGINELVSGSLSAYLTGSGSAAITTAIKDLASSLTKNCKNDLEKANALFTYVRSSISYSYYYNTKYKASGTLTNKKGNCCDKSNLFVALCRASGIAARYCHSTSCSFNSGLNCGHVWAQVAVDGVWYAADTTSSSNTLGHINNWNTNSVGTINQYATLPF